MCVYVCVCACMGSCVYIYPDVSCAQLKELAAVVAIRRVVLLQASRRQIPESQVYNGVYISHFSCKKTCKIVIELWCYKQCYNQ